MNIISSCTIDGVPRRMSIYTPAMRDQMVFFFLRTSVSFISAIIKPSTMPIMPAHSEMPIVTPRPLAIST